jgi:hypothetical protein
MTNKTRIARDTHHHSSSSPDILRISPLLSASAVAFLSVGIVTGLIEYLDRSPARKVHAPGTSAWTPHLIEAAIACALYGVAWSRHRRRFGRGSARRLLLAPLGATAASRLIATMRQASWRTVAALPPLALIAYGFWRIGEQITAGLDPNFTVNAWGGPTYLGAMTCHYLDCLLIIVACAWLLDRILFTTP